MENLVIPDSSITIDGLDYKLACDLGTLKDIQHAFDEEILNFIGYKLESLPFDKLAKLFLIGIKNAKERTAPSQAEVESAIVNEIGIRYAAAQAMAWLVVAVTPNKDKQKKTAEMQQLLQVMQSL